MRLGYYLASYQLFFRVLPIIVVLFFSCCRRNSEELPVMPPSTHPLLREYIGFGVVINSFTHLLSESGQAGVSEGYLRRGTVVRILERRQLINRGTAESWVLVEGNYQSPGHRIEANISRGWLPETNLEIYDNESRANTASTTISQ